MTACPGKSGHVLVGGGTVGALYFDYPQKKFRVPGTPLKREKITKDENSYMRIDLHNMASPQYGTLRPC